MDILDASQSAPLDGGPSFSLRHRLRRALWLLAWALAAAWTPPALRGWRRALLRLFGARMARGSDVCGSARVWYPPNLDMAENSFIGPGVICYDMGPVALGPGARVLAGAHLCGGTHDAESVDFQLIAKPIRIGAQACVATEAFVGPGTEIGEGAVVAARAVVFGRLSPWTVYAGNPGRPAGARTPDAGSTSPDPRSPTCAPRAASD